MAFLGQIFIQHPHATHSQILIFAFLFGINNLPSANLRQDKKFGYSQKTHNVYSKIFKENNEIKNSISGSSHTKLLIIIL